MQPGSWLNQKTCPAGHTYLAQLVACPTCAKEGGAPSSGMNPRPRMPQKTVVMEAPLVAAPPMESPQTVALPNRPIIPAKKTQVMGGPPPVLDLGTQGVPQMDVFAEAPVEEEGVAPLAYLMCKRGVFEGADFDLYPPTDGPFSSCKIGRDPACDISFADDADMEPVHTEIRCLMRGGELIFIIIDRSQSGTYMNANPQPIELEELIEGDTILCGSSIFQFGLYQT